MDVSPEETTACREPTDDCLEKTKATTETVQEPMEVEIATDLEEMKATGLEANPEETEAVAELQEIPNDEAAVQTIRTLKDRSEDLQPAVGYRNPRKKRTKDDVVPGTPEGRTSGTAETQQRHKAPRPETIVTTEKQGKCRRGSETDPTAADCKTNSRVFHQTPKSQRKDIVDELATAQPKDDTAHRLRAGDIAAPTTLGIFSPTNQKRRKWQ
jgi:hypothetical protein